MKTAQQLKEENTIQDRIARGISNIRIAKVQSLINSYETGNLTASEFLRMTDNLLQDELKQTLGL
jgi:hypothetical protein